MIIIVIIINLPVWLSLGIKKTLDLWTSWPLTHSTSFVAAPQGESHGAGVPARSNDGVDEDGAHVAEEELVGHEVASVQDDLGQQVEEEDGGRQGEGLGLVRSPHDAPEDKADEDEQAALGNYAGHMMVQLKHCR